MNPSYLILDFDNTIVQGETMDDLARISLSNNPEREAVISEIKKTTALGMSGAMPFDESLSKRLALLHAHTSHLEKLVPSLKEKIDPSVIANIEFFKRHTDNIYIVSGGFKSVIDQVLEELPFYKDHIFGNAFTFDNDGWIIGADEENPLSQQHGKCILLESLNLGGSGAIVGDGMSDAELKLKGLADFFIAYTGHVEREPVIMHADETAASFDEVIHQIEGWE
ncbi:MAG: HAD-IB family phosphatase [Candidatus Marinimicrobia bacterium]|nr:HAD-IB family phosphatase [Candidatus Neomarinimicrobiota bacterium]